jgi:hypothetical protein
MQLVCMDGAALHYFTACTVPGDGELLWYSRSGKVSGALNY